MSLAERLQAVKAQAKPSLDLWFEGFDDKDRTAWLDACADLRIPTSVLMRIAKEEGGVAVGKDAMLNHRRSHGFAR